MKTTPIPRNILIVYLVSLGYWVCLSFKNFSADIIGYKDLGSILYYHGLTGYLSTGLHREPLYPLLCSLAMGMENISGITFTHIMADASIMILAVTQILTYVILRKLNIRPWICSLTLLYLALSPAITSSAFNILAFCEIITYPLVLAAIICGYSGWDAVKQNDTKAACCYGALTGILFTALALTKAAFECICPAYLLVFLLEALYKNKISTALVCFLAAAGILFYFPVITYKCLNKKYNGNFAIADRGPQTLYGNVAHRIKPLTPSLYLASLASVAGDNVCMDFFKPEECFSWSFHVSDSLGAEKLNELNKLHLSTQAVTDNLLRLSKEQALSHLPQYTLMTATESLRGYFWEGRNDLISLRYVMAALTFFAMLYCCIFIKQIPELMMHLLAIIFFFLFFYSFFDILPRHILPIVPLYLISIAYCLNSLLKTL